MSSSGAARERQRAFWDLMREGRSSSAACETLGVHRRQRYRWIRRLAVGSQSRRNRDRVGISRSRIAYGSRTCACRAPGVVRSRGSLGGSRRSSRASCAGTGTQAGSGTVRTRRRSSARLAPTESMQSPSESYSRTHQNQCCDDRQKPPMLEALTFAEQHRHSGPSPFLREAQTHALLAATVVGWFSTGAIVMDGS